MKNENSIVESDKKKFVGKSKPRKNLLKPVQKYRAAIQIGITLICIWIGIEFYYFVKYLETAGVSGSTFRPPGVEGFLPISSLMSLYYLFILLGATVMSLAFGKSFCSWVCPIGLLSGYLGDLGEKIFGRRVKLPRWLDYPLRSLKYLLLAFFVYSIFFLMTTASLRAFLDSPYNLVADIKMYYFFADISRFSLIVIAVLFLASIPVRNFWCRYFCPYGALLGLTALLSPLKIRRNSATCIDCGKCAKVCPSFIKVDKISTVVSDECTSCLNCIDICPIADTMVIKPEKSNRIVTPKMAAIGILGLFLLTIGIGMISGHWQNNIRTEEYLYHQERLHAYGHPTGADEIKELNEKETGH
jgi:polyferredoxin